MEKSDKELTYELMKMCSKPRRTNLTIKDAIEFRRTQYQLNKSDMAKVLGISVAHYSEFISGKRGLPINSIRNAFIIGVPAVSLFEIQEDYPSEEKEEKYAEQALQLDSASLTS